jgi:hypothetical protein
MTDREKAVVLQLLDAWEHQARTVVHEYSCDWDADLARLSLEKEAWKKRLGLD